MIFLKSLYQVETNYCNLQIKKEWRKIIRAISLKLKLNRSDIHPHFPPLDIIFQVDVLKVLILKLEPGKLER